MQTVKPLVVLTLSLMLAAPVQARENLFPFIGKVIKNDVNVRSGQSTNFESLGRLAIESEIVVHDKKYSWYKIQLPPNFKLYLSEQFVFVRPNKVGEVLGNRINVRAKPNTQATIMTQVSKGDKLEVVAVKDGWCHIKPLEGTYGWVSEEFIKFHSKAVDSYEAKPLLSPEEKREIDEKKKKEQERIRRAELERKKQEEERRKLSIVGKLQKVRPGYASRGAYKIVTTDGLTYVIDEPGHLFDNFAGTYVAVEAKITSFSNADAPYPVIKVDKIQLVL